MISGRSPRAARPGVIVLLIVVLLGAALLVTGLLAGRDRTVDGQASAAESIVGVGGNAAPPLAIRHIGSVSLTNQEDDLDVAGVLADVNTFWSQTLPSTFGKQFSPLAGGYVSVDATAASGSTYCVSTPDQIAGNAYYCPTGDAIVYDSAGLVPVLIGHYGVAGLTASFAHEFGHAIQARIGPTAADRSAHPQQYPSILIEAQGDCFSGAFLAWAVAGHSAHIRLPAASMVRAVAPLLDFRDPVTVAVDDQTAHGLSIDRLAAILRGYREGAAACHSLTRATMSPALGRPGLVAGTATPRFRSTAAVLAAAGSSIDSFAASLPALRSPGSGSGSGKVQADGPDLLAAAPYGQFAQAAALALARGRSLTGTPAGAACFAGAWTASVYGHAPAGDLGSWAGDVDEALDMLRARPAATFDELAGFADGFAKGWPACAA